MHISKLEIFGFKSFAKKETVLFNSGITGIVGPNGCGKTNIVDAIRWVLGEQKTKRLRSSKMEDVIFNGASNVKPLGLCEVYLTIENNKGVHLKNRKIKLNFVTKKDLKAISIAKKYNLNNFALSFTNSNSDLINFCKLLPKKNKYFKIETRNGLKSL